jgi:hypothetical protein
MSMNYPTATIELSNCANILQDSAVVHPRVSDPSRPCVTPPRPASSNLEAWSPRIQPRRSVHRVSTACPHRIRGFNAAPPQLRINSSAQVTRNFSQRSTHSASVPVLLHRVGVRTRAHENVGRRHTDEDLDSRTCSHYVMLQRVCTQYAALGARPWARRDTVCTNAVYWRVVTPSRDVECSDAKYGWPTVAAGCTLRSSRQRDGEVGKDPAQPSLTLCTMP